MPFEETGTQELLERVLGARAARAHRRDRGRRAAPTTSCSRSARPPTSHIEIDISQIRERHRRPAARAARGPLADPALDRRARHDRVGRRLPRAAARLPGRRGRLRRRTCRSGSPRTTSSRRSTRCPPSSAAWARARAPGRPSCSRSSAREIVQTTPVAGRAREDLDQHLPLRALRAPNLLMMECEQYGANVFDVIDLINHDYPRGGIATPGPDRRAPACARTSRSPRSARARRACCSRSRACTRRVPLFLVEGLKRAARRLAARPQGRRARPHLQARLRRPARLALAQADPPARARAGPRRPPRPPRAATSPSRSSRRSRAPTPW